MAPNRTDRTTRRALLARLGLGVGLAYAAPVLSGAGVARASGASRPGISRASVSGPAPARPEMVVLLAPGQDLQPLRQAGYAVLSSRANATLSRQAARLRPPAGRSMAEAQAEIARLLPGALAEANSLYRPEALTCEGADCAAQRLIGWQPQDLSARPRIGMIDTGVNADHPALRGQDLSLRQVPQEGRDPAGRQHGTAIAAMLVGRPEGRVPGLVPQARLVAIEAFHTRPDGAAADAFALLEALDILIQDGVQVINMSFSGPENPVLLQIIREAHEAGIGLVAAAGNGGPGAPPAYPAAWPEVIAVTALDGDLNPYRQAARGPHVDLAAPGVNLWTAASIEGGRLRSGTSYAAPFVSAAMAVAMARDGLDARGARARLLACARDLGAPGRDPVFGQGLLASGSGCAAGTAEFLSASGE